MPYDVAIKITSEADTAAVQKAEEATRNLGKAVADTNKTLGKETENAARQSSESLGKLNKTVDAGTLAQDALTKTAGSLARGLGSLLGGAIAANSGISLITNAISRFIQEKADFDKAVSTKDLTFFRQEVEKLNDLAAKRQSQGLLGSAFSILKGAVTGSDEVLFLGNLNDKLATMREQLQGLQIEKMQSLTRELERQARLANAQRTGGPLAAIGLQGQFSAEDIVRNAQESGITGTLLQSGVAAARSAAAAQRALAISEATKALEAQVDAQHAANIELTIGKEAADEFRLKTLEQTDAVRMLGADGRNLVDVLRSIVRQTREYNEAEQQRAALQKFIAESGAALDVQRQEELDGLAKELALKQKMADLDLQLLRAAGAPEASILERQIELLQAQREALENSPVVKEPGQLAEIQKQIQIAQIGLYKLQNTGIDVAGEIGRVVTDVTSAVVSGTLKWAEVGKSILASFVRVGLEQFTNFLRQSMQAMQSSSALAAVGAAPIAGGSAGSISLGGGGGGGFFGGIGNFLSSFLPSGSSLGGLATAGAGGFALSQLFGGGTLSNILSSAGSIGGSLLGGTGFGQSILTGVFDLLTGGGTSVLGLGGAGAAGVFGEMLGDFLLPGVGSLIGILLSQLFQPKINPTVITRSKTEGFLYDAIANQFKFGKTTTTATGTDISQSVVNSTKNQVQQILEQYSRQWTDILNLFPVIVHDQMIPKLEHANQLLNQLFGRLKFSEGGSRTIAEELQDLGERAAPARFFAASRGILGAGLSESFRLAGLGGLSALAERQFADAPLGLNFNGIDKLPGLRPPRNKKDVEPFTKALSDFISLSGGLASVSGSGITPFLTDQDRARLESQFTQVLNITDGSKFAPAVEALKQKIQPITDFLNSALQQSTDIFGRGLIAALEAASESAAQSQFLQGLGEGTKQIIFQGITEAFIASAQFNDLLAPVQKIIREFTQQAANTGQTPDLAAFRAALFPAIEDITTRAETLAPLIAELQKLGVDITGALGSLRGQSNITINIDSISGTEDAEALARKLAALLQAGVAPN